VHHASSRRHLWYGKALLSPLKFYTEKVVWSNSKTKPQTKQMDSGLAVKITLVSLNTVFSLLGGGLTLTLGIWAAYDAHKINGQKNTTNCSVSTLQHLLVADSVLYFVSFSLVILATLCFALETFLKNNDSTEEKKSRTNLSGCCNFLRGFIGSGSLIIVIYLSIIAFKSGHCKSESPYVYAFVKPYIIANYVIMAVGSVFVCCAFICVCFSAIVVGVLGLNNT